VQLIIGILIMTPFDHRVPESSYKTHAMNLLLLALELDSF
jgi:hypothetical protein